MKRGKRRARLTPQKRAELRDRFADLLGGFYQPFCEDVMDLHLGVTFDQAVEVLTELEHEIKQATRKQLEATVPRTKKPRKEIKLSLNEKGAQIVHAALVKFAHMSRDGDSPESAGDVDQIRWRLEHLMDHVGIEVDE